MMKSKIPLPSSKDNTLEAFAAQYTPRLSINKNGLWPRPALQLVPHQKPGVPIAVPSPEDLLKRNERDRELLQTVSGTSNESKHDMLQMISNPCLVDSDRDQSSVESMTLGKTDLELNKLLEMYKPILFSSGYKMKDENDILKASEAPVEEDNSKRCTIIVNQAALSQEVLELETPVFNPTRNVLTLGSSTEIARNHILNLRNKCHMMLDTTMERIFSYLHPGDLLACRRVCKQWNQRIHQADFFLEKVVYVANMVKSYDTRTDHITYADLTSYPTTQFRNARFQYIDSKFLKNSTCFVFKNSDNAMYFPSKNFLQFLTGIEFRNCFLLWKTFLNILVNTQVTSVEFNNCNIVGDYLNPANTSASCHYMKRDQEFDDSAKNAALRRVKSLIIQEFQSLSSVSNVLKKFNGATAVQLETLKISFQPPEKLNEDEMSDNGNCKENAVYFCNVMKGMLALCSKCLRVLFLDLQHEITLDAVGYDLSQELKTLKSHFNLTEFQLSPGMHCWMRRRELAPKSHISLSMNNFTLNKITNEQEIQNHVKYAALSLITFLESQKNLEALGLPLINYPDPATYFKSVLQRLPCKKSLKYLAIPSESFLPEDVFAKFPNLTRFKVESHCPKIFGTGWNLFGTQLTGHGTQALSSMQHLSITSLVLPYCFRSVFENLHELTFLEINSGFEIAIIGDRELQCVIKNLRKLQTLIISNAGQLTDHGLTGIPSRNCNLMFKMQSYHKRINLSIWKSKEVTGRPISDLKGLRKLVLMGESEITDVGIGYGLQFIELTNCHMPYSDYITDWGVRRIGETNPSLKSLTFTGISQLNKKAFLTLKKTHRRMNKGDPSRSMYFSERTSAYYDNFTFSFPTIEECRNVAQNVRNAVKRGLDFLTNPLGR